MTVHSQNAISFFLNLKVGERSFSSPLKWQTQNTLWSFLDFAFSFFEVIRDYLFPSHSLKNRCHALLPHLVTETKKVQKSLTNGDLQTLRDFQTLQKVKAKIRISGLASHLKEDATYRAFKTALKEMTPLAQDKISSLNVESEEEKEEKALLTRWTHSRAIQRDFAAICPSQKLPLKALEVPKGAILVTNGKARILEHLLEGHHLNLFQRIKKISNFLIYLISGRKKQAIHAELSFGKGKVFHMDKDKGAFFSGSGHLETRLLTKKNKEKVAIAYDIFVPSDKATSHMLSHYNKTHPATPIKTKEELWQKIEEDIEQTGRKAKANAYALFKLLFPSKREKGYNGAAAWQPEKKLYACSAAVASIFAKYGLDMGKEFDKKVEEMMPMDFYESSHLTCVYHGF